MINATTVGIESSDLVGFIRRGPRLDVLLPKVYRSSGNDASDQQLHTSRAVRLARVLARYRSLEVSRQLESAVLGAVPGAELIGRPELLDSLDAAATIRTEYLENGLYYVKRVIRRIAQTGSAIDWARTLAQTTPFLGEDYPIYLNAFIRERTRDPAAKLYRLHASIVREVLHLFGDDAQVPETSSLSEDEWSGIRLQPLQFLEDLIGATFRDRGVTLLRLIGQYIDAMHWSTELSNELQNDFCLTRDFELVWEDMLRVVFHNANVPQATLPRGAWLHQGESAKNGIRPRIDGLRIQQDPSTGRVLILFDAKDKPIFPGLRSGTEADHYKQIIYRQLLTVPEGTTVYNILFFPVAIRNDETPPIRLLGMHRWPTLANTDVWEAAIDFDFVARVYLGDSPANADALIGRLLSNIRSCAIR